jgi:hypothetical protein
VPPEASKHVSGADDFEDDWPRLARDRRRGHHRETLIRNLTMTNAHPARIVAFNTAEGWSA